MPLAIRERIDSRRTVEGDDPSVELVCDVTGTADDLTAKAFAILNTPVTYNGLPRISLSLDPEWVDEVQNDGLWTATVRYGIYHPTGEMNFAFDTGGTQQHITQSLETIGKYPSDGAADHKGAIGVTGDMVEGVDITIPAYSFGETHYLPDAAVTPEYKAVLFQLTGRVNNAAWRGFKAGEVLFLGACGSKRGAEDWEVSFRFAASENLTNITCGDITGIEKKGWHYLWVQYQSVEDEAAKQIAQKPIAVYVERIYKTGDFNLLGIGG